MSRGPLVFGADGGGTKTIGLLADENGNVLARREMGATNPNVVGVDTSARHIVRLMTQCCEDVHCAVDDLSAAVLGLAGAGREGVRRELRDAIQSQLGNQGGKLPPMAIETDARIALEGAFDGGPGVVVIAGTGSIVIGKNQHRDLIIVGGWGRVLGDEGSGYHIGREAIRAIALQMDGRGEAGKLLEVMSRKYGWKSREDIIAAVYQEKLDLPSLAPLVMVTAADNDLTCQRILQNAAAQLLEQVRAVVMRMGILRKVGLVMSGGLIGQETVYANVLHMKIMKLLPQVDIRPPMHPPAHGAVLMALAKAREV
jgi:N-acetylglucosamine kinase-like BadF-type ATPase